MNLKDRRALKDAANHSLSISNGSKLILLHTGIALLFSAILCILDYIMEQQIGTTSGLSGIGLRSTLSTVQTMLRIVHTVFLPFWQIGYVFVTLKLAREEQTTSGDLLEGFRCFGPVFRYQLLTGLMTLGILLISGYVAGTAYFMTPLSLPLREALLPLLTEDAISQDPVALSETIAAIIIEHLAPMLILTAVIALGIGIPIFCRYRMASLCLMDSPEKGAICALRTSRKMMRSHCMELFRLDLSFWYFYALSVFINLLCYMDVFLNEINRPLPIPADAQYFLFYGLSLAGQLVLYYFYKNKVSVTYANAYLFLKLPEETPQNQF